MNHTMSGSFESIVICPLRWEDIEILRVIRNREDTRSWFFYSDIVSVEEQRTWYEHYLQEPNDYMFSIFTKKTGGWVGAAALYHVDSAKKQAEFGRFLINPACKKQGFGKATVNGVCSIGFTQLGLHSIHLEVLESNCAAFACYTNAGFNIVSRSARNGCSTLLMKLNRKRFESLR